MKWTDSMTCTFVEIYAKHDCLWNPLDPKYKILAERDKAYTSMSAQFLTETKKYLSKHEVKNKIKTLRTTYLQQVRKVLDRSTPTYTFVPTLSWFHTMDNILRNNTSSKHFERKSTDNLDEQQPTDLPTSTQTWVEPNMDEASIMDDSAIFESESQPDPLTSTFEEDTIVKQETDLEDKDKPPTRKKIKLKKSKTHFCDVKHSSTPSNIIEDEFDIYGKYIASQLRRMDLSKALRIQLAIQNLVSEARMSGVK